MYLGWCQRCQRKLISISSLSACVLVMQVLVIADAAKDGVTIPMMTLPEYCITGKTNSSTVALSASTL